jgi:hypothetical protein
MQIISDEVIAARAGWSRELARGQVLRLIDLEGKQAVDFLCYNARDYEDRYAAADTMKINGNIFIRKGTVLCSVNCNPMFTVVDDTCGFHDTILRLLLLRAQPQALRHGAARHGGERRPRRAAGRNGRARGDLQLPADEQSGQRLQPYSGSGHRLPARGIMPG